MRGRTDSSSTPGQLCLHACMGQQETASLCQTEISKPASLPHRAVRWCTCSRLAGSTSVRALAGVNSTSPAAAGEVSMLLSAGVPCLWAEAWLAAGEAAGPVWLLVAECSPCCRVPSKAGSSCCLSAACWAGAAACSGLAAGGSAASAGMLLHVLAPSSGLARALCCNSWAGWLGASACRGLSVVWPWIGCGAGWLLCSSSSCAPEGCVPAHMLELSGLPMQQQAQAEAMDPDPQCWQARLALWSVLRSQPAG